jgi:hypothetical protein
LSFHAWIAGDVLTAADLMTYAMKQSGKPCAVIHKSGSQACAISTNTALLFDVEDFDTDAAHSTVSNTSRYTVQTAGKYSVAASVIWGGTVTTTQGIRDAWFAVNGAGGYYADRELNPSATADSKLEFGGVLPQSFSVGDYIEIIAWQNSTTGTMAVVGAYMSVEYVSA